MLEDLLYLMQQISKDLYAMKESADKKIYKEIQGTCLDPVEVTFGTLVKLNS
jgi:hypothetical protein